MTWYDINFNGQNYVENLTGASQKTMSILGIHGYATEAEAQQHPQTMNTLQGLAGGAQALAGVSGSATNIPTPGGVVTGAGGTGAAAGTAISDAAAVTDFLARLQEPNTWLRIAEAIVGGVFLFIAIKSMTAPVTAPVTRSVKSGVGTAVKVGALF
jgi:hypothetical protein